MGKTLKNTKEKKDVKPEKKEKKEKIEKKVKKEKKEKSGAKRALSAYFFFINENREDIKKKNPGIKVTEIAKKAGELWSKMT